MQFDVYVDEFLVQVQEKINPSLIGREVLIIFRDKIVCGSPSTVRKLGACCPISISAAVNDHGRLLSDVIYINHSVMSMHQFGLYWRVSRNLLMVLNSISNGNCCRVAINNFRIRFHEADFYLGQKLSGVFSSITEYAISLITRVIEECGFNRGIHVSETKQSGGEEFIPESYFICDNEHCTLFLMSLSNKNELSTEKYQSFFHDCHLINHEHSLCRFHPCDGRNYTFADLLNYRMKAALSELVALWFNLCSMKLNCTVVHASSMPLLLSKICLQIQLFSGSSSDIINLQTECFDAFPVSFMDELRKSETAKVFRFINDMFQRHVQGSDKINEMNLEMPISNLQLSIYFKSDNSHIDHRKMKLIDRFNSHRAYDIINIVPICYSNDEHLSKSSNFDLSSHSFTYNCTPPSSPPAGDLMDLIPVENNRDGTRTTAELSAEYFFKHWKKCSSGSNDQTLLFSSELMNCLFKTSDHNNNNITLL